MNLNIILAANDFEIYSSEKTIGHAIESASPTETVRKCKELFFPEEL